MGNAASSEGGTTFSTPWNSFSVPTTLALQKQQQEEEKVLPRLESSNNSVDSNTNHSRNSNNSDEDIQDEPTQAQSTSTTPANTNSTSILKSSSTSSGCYRLPMFAKRSNPLIFHDASMESATSHDDEEDDDETDTRQKSSSSCFPLNPLTPKLMPISNAENSTEKVSPGNPNNTDSMVPSNSLLSFQSCRDGGFFFNSTSSRSLTNANNDENSDYLLGLSCVDDNATMMGCVGSPLGRSSQKGSWANLVGLDDLMKTPKNSLEYTQEELDMVNGLDPTPSSDLRRPREYWIVTTAALPWMTGTAVNPLLRAAYLSQRNRRLLLEEESNTTLESKSTLSSSQSTVTLVLPWLETPQDRIALYGKGWENVQPDYQEAFIRKWLSESAQLPDEAKEPSEGGIAIQWYPARYHAALSSIFAMGDVCELIPPQSQDMICILEEPEHVNFFRAPGRLSYRDKFPHVIGIMHTNYQAYARNHYTGLLAGPIIGAYSSLLVRAYCDKVVKLSPVLQSYAPYKEVVSNVHGIRHEFFKVPQRPVNNIYFIGKLLWAKGLDKLLELQAIYRKATGSYFAIDIIGSGPEEAEIQKSFLGREFFNPLMGRTSSSNLSTVTMEGGAEQKEEEETASTSMNPASAARRYWRKFRQPIPARFLGRQDHAAIGPDYKIFINPSITEVLCTTTAEAVAMGKWVIIPKHASNEFFLTFENCLQYSNRREFVELLQHCQNNDPPGWMEPAPENDADAEAETEEQRLDRSKLPLYQPLSWQAATERFIETSYLSQRDAKRCDRLQPNDKSIQEWHYALGKGTHGDVIRKIMFAGPVAEQVQYMNKTMSASSSLSTMPNTATTATSEETSVPLEERSDTQSPLGMDLLTAA